MNISTRCNFDYQCGGFKTRGHALITLAALHRAGVKAELENSGDAFRIWKPDAHEYFWPETEDSADWVLKELVTA